MQKAIVAEISESPDGRYKIIAVMLGDDKLGVAMHEVRVTSRQGKILSSWQGYHRYTDAIWNSDCSIVAVNDRQTNGGDYVYVVALSGNTAKIVRKPGELFGVKMLIRSHVFSGNVANLTRYSVTAQRFLMGGVLEVDMWVRTGFYPGEKMLIQEYALLLFDVAKRTWRIVHKSKEIYK